MSNIDINQKISHFIEDQFPDHYVEGTDPTNVTKSTIVAFVEAYYEFLEENYADHFLASRKMFTYRDIDTTLSSFIKHFKLKYLNEFPIINGTDERLVIKNIIDLYRSKGSEKAIKLLIRLLFNKDAEVYYPAIEILRPSTSKWVLPRYIEVTRSSRNSSFLGKVITGSESGVQALVENLITKRVNGKLFDVLYLSDITGGSFQTGEKVSDNSIYINSPTIIGSLSDITIDSSEDGNSIGDIVDIISSSGISGKARITAILDVDNQVEFALNNGGYGYSLSEAEVLVSNTTLFLDNSGLNFDELGTVKQFLYDIVVDSNTSFTDGDSIEVLDQSSNTIATGIIAASNNSSNTITFEKHTGSLASEYTMTLVSNSTFIVGETIEEGAEVTLTVDNTSPGFSDGERLLQADVANGVYTNIAYGTVSNTASDIVTLVDVWGTFINGKSVEGQTSLNTANIVSSNVISSGVSGSIISSNGDTIIVETTQSFTANTKIRGSQTKNINTIDSFTYVGPSSIEVNGANTANIISISDITAIGTVVGQNETVVGLVTSNNTFLLTSTANNKIFSGNTEYVFTRIGTGSGATFDIGTLTANTTETVIYNDDAINGQNIVGIDYLDITIGTALDSGVGYVANITINDGGTGYSNGQSITFSGGGYDNDEPMIPASMTVVVDANGTITDVNIETSGFGYFTEPQISITGGSGANVELTMGYGYGFPAQALGNFDNDTIDIILNSATKTIGEIATLKNINPGLGYDATVFTKIIERDISSFDLFDYIITYELNSGSFANGELLDSDNGSVCRIESITNHETYTMKLKRMSFENPLRVGDTLIGRTSGASANVISVSLSTNEAEMGFNANVSSTVVLQSGVIAAVEIIDSGFGYLNNETVTIKAENTTNTIGTGTTSVETQGIGTGFWESTESHLNQQKLHDNDFYQEFSYQIKAEVSFDKYKEVVKDLFHVSGTKLFGLLINNSNKNITYLLDTTIADNNFVIANSVWTDNGVWIDSATWLE